MSEHTVPVVRIPSIQPIEGKDRIGFIELGGFTVVVNKSDWREGDFAAYVEPDLLVDTRRAEFAWLAELKDSKYNEFSQKDPNGVYHRVKVKKLGGVPSMGLLVPISEVLDHYGHPDVFEGYDAFKDLGVIHFSPPEGPAKTQVLKRKLPWWVRVLNHVLPYWAMPYFRRWTKQPIRVPEPKGYHPKYDVTNLRKESRMFEPGEKVVAFEKIHGQTIRVTFDGKRLHVGSSREWKPAGSEWHQALANTPGLERMARDLRQWTFYGEVYGPVQKGFHYCSPQERRIMVFDILDSKGRWIAPMLRMQMLGVYGVKHPPMLTIRSFDFKDMLSRAEGPSEVCDSGHIREGLVVETWEPKIHPRYGRAKAKVVSNAYLERV